MQNKPPITIIIPTYNRAHLIRETLDSIILQTYTNWECIIVDDNSIDSTQKVINEYLKKEPRFNYFLRTSKYQKGASGTRNYGLDLAHKRNAQYIQFFDDDDIMYSKKLELQIAPFLRNSNLNFTVCKFDKLVEIEPGKYRIDRPDYQLSFPHVGDAILTGDFKINTLSVLWNMKIIDQFRFDERLQHAEEWELFTRIGYHYPDNYQVVDAYLYAYRKHPVTLTMGKDDNYEKRKTSSVIRIILLEYLTKNKLHTKNSILFLTKTFLTYSYNPILVQKLLYYSQQNSGFSYKLILFLKTGLSFGKFYRKVILKLATWV